jgi:hypothetical protein
LKRPRVPAALAETVLTAALVAIRGGARPRRVVLAPAITHVIAA